MSSTYWKNNQKFHTVKYNEMSGIKWEAKKTINIALIRLIIDLCQHNMDQRHCLRN